MDDQAISSSFGAVHAQRSSPCASRLHFHYLFSPHAKGSSDCRQFHHCSRDPSFPSSSRSPASPNRGRGAGRKHPNHSSPDRSSQAAATAVSPADPRYPQQSRSHKQLRAPEAPAKEPAETLESIPRASAGPQGNPADLPQKAPEIPVLADHSNSSPQQQKASTQPSTASNIAPQPSPVQSSPVAIASPQRLTPSSHGSKWRAVQRASQDLVAPWSKSWKTAVWT